MNQTRVNNWTQDKKLVTMTIAWSAVVIGSPFYRTDPTAPMEGATLGLYRIHPVIPLIILLALIAYEQYPRLRVWQYFTIKKWTIAIAIILPTMLGIDYYLLTQNVSSPWGTINTIGLMLVATLLIASNFKDETKGILVSIMGSFFAMMVWEVIYLTRQYYVFQSVMSGGDLAWLIVTIVPMMIPFVVVAAIMRAKLTKTSAIALSIFTALMLIWFIPGKTWLMVDWVEGQGWINTGEVNWPIYRVNRAAKVAIELFIPTLLFSRQSKTVLGIKQKETKHA